jgi:hypothetical protein
MRNLVLIIMLLCSFVSRAQLIYESKGDFPEHFEYNKELLLELSNSMNKEFDSGFLSLVQQEMIASISQSKVISRIDTFLVIDVKLSEERGSIYNAHVYFIKSINDKKYYYTNSDTLMWKDRGKNKVFLPIFSLKGKFLTQPFSVDRNRLLIHKEIVFWKNTECETYDINSLKIVNNGGCQKTFLSFLVVDECKGDLRKPVKKRLNL